MSQTQIRGQLLLPHRDERRWTLVPDGLITIDEGGTITGVDPEVGADCLVAETRPGAVWMPGFVDTHIHFPQTMILGSASGPLLTWLERSVFPEEQRFAQEAYAARVAERFCDAMLQHGTTCASIFSSSHPGATRVLFEALERRGMRGDVGLTLMDRGAPEPLLLPAAEALGACEVLAESWHGRDGDRLRFRVTPRFALSCTPELLRGAGALAERLGLPVQTHLSENGAEIEATLDAFPEARDYLGVYEDSGLVGEHSLFAHSIWLSEHEWDQMAAARAAVSHCPDSNFFLGSGAMPLDQALSREIRCGLGTDIGAGRSFSLRRTCSRAFDASRITGASTDAGELLWLATRGGACAMGRGDQVGLVEAGFEADLVAIRPPQPQAAGVEGLCEGLVFLEDWGGVEEVRVRGQVVWER